MRHISSLPAMANTNTREQPNKQPGSTSSYSDEQRRRVKTFYLRLQTVYGVTRYKTAFPDQDAERLSMREWAPNILALTDEQLADRLNYAKGMMHQREWQWPDVGLILSGGGSDAVSGHAALSYRSIADIEADSREWGLLPPPVSGEGTMKTGREALAELLAAL